MTTITKVKMFNALKYIELETLEIDINNFIKDKDIRSIQYNLNKNRYTAMVVYETSI